MRCNSFMYAYVKMYNLSPKYEGFMLFFPAKLRHCVYPFYETDEPRISIAGNLSYFDGVAPPSGVGF